MVVNFGDRISFMEGTSRDIYHPSCDIMLTSVATVYGAKAIGVILTGMGDDGVKGMGAIRNARGMTIAESEQTCIVYGMPREAARHGVVDQVLPLGEIGEMFANAGVNDIARHPFRAPNDSSILYGTV